MSRTRILFVTWDGPQVNYLESLFLPIFEGLRPFGYDFDVLQFRWGDAALTKSVRERCGRSGVGYRGVHTLRRFGGAGAFLSALWGARHVRAAVRRFGSDLLMPRSLMPALSVLAAGGAKLRPILFDADGLAADERVEFGGLSPSGRVYRILRDVEAQAVRRAGAVLVRTRRAGEILVDRAGPPVRPESMHVVANGRDPDVFSPGDEASRLEVRREIGVPADAPLVVYAGSVGPQYRLEAVSALMREVRRLRPDSFLLVLSGSPADAAKELLAAAPELEAGMIAMRAAPADVHRYLAAGDLGTAYRAASFSMAAVAPVKLAEYLLCGLPVVGTAGIGDTGAPIEAGVFLSEREGAPAAAQWLVRTVLPQRDRFRARAREIGIMHYSLERSVQTYLAALRSLPRRSDDPPTSRSSATRRGALVAKE